MMDGSTIKSILNHLGGTAIYVIKQENHEILYYNDIVKKTTPEVEIGQICHEIWKGSCYACPLNDIGSKESNSTISYNDPFGDTVDITATKMLWTNDIPAYLISVTPHVLTDTEKKLEIEKSHLMNAVTQVYPLLVSLNFNTKEFKTVVDKDFLGICVPKYGKADEFIEFMSKTIHEDMREQYIETFKYNSVFKAFNEGKNDIYMEHKQYDSSGAVHWTSTVVLKMNSSRNGMAATMLASVIDHRKQTELEREAFATGITNIFGECIVLNVTRGTYTFYKVDELMAKLPKTGKFEDINNEYINKFIYPPERKKFSELFSLRGIRDQIAQGRKIISFDCRRMTPCGEYRWVEMTGVIVDQHDNEDLRMILMFRDIHELKVAQENQKKANNRFVSAVNGLYNQIYEADIITDKMYSWKMTDGMLTNTPSQFSMKEHFKNVIENLIHDDYKDYYHDIVDTEELLKQFNEGTREIYKECPRKISDGTYHWYSTLAQILYRDNNHCQVMFYLKDLENAKKEEERKRSALLDALALAEQANNAKTEFLSRMSHDIRTPMNVIIGMSAIARSNIGDSSKIEECLDKIGISADFLLSLINDILDMSKIESGKMTLNNQPFNIREFIKEIVSMCQIQTEQKNQTLNVNISEKLDRTYIGDSLCLNQIIMNLVGNAIKYTQNGGEISIDVNLMNKGSDNSIVEFIIEDNGIGMSKEFLKHLYEPFEQEKKYGGRVFEGSGLGLSITRNLVHLMGGKISVKSKLGVGTRFTVRIPFYISKDSADGGNISKILPDNSGSFEQKNLSGRNILLVEDNEINMDIAKTLLEMNGLNVDMAYNGVYAVEKFVSSDINYYDAVLMDIRMPEMDGLEATRRIRSLKRKDAQTIPIIAMTANAFSDDIIKTAEAGMNSHLSKPVDVKQLLSELKRYIN